ncbi:MAG: hypothetical protein AAF828_08615 [Bacteroidota bacterium]
MSVIFLNSHRAKSGLVNGKKLPEDYIMAAKFFDCGIIDRTETLEVGFDQRVLDPIPAFDPSFTLSFAEICQQVGAELVAEAKRTKQTIQLLWSGGIDSTVALIALLKNMDPDELAGRIEVFASMKSINEYPFFFRHFILGKLPYRIIAPPITQHFSERGLIVTGEHGDQLFGSDKLLPLIANGLAYESYEDILPIYLVDKFGNHPKNDRLLRYLQPLIQACPTEVKTTFDLFWWLNYTIKWQQVSLRLPIFTFRPEVSELASRFRHFFRDPRFEQWSFHQHERRAATSLTTYKQAAKDYILDFTGDSAYWQQKSKEPSLQHVIINRKKQGNQRYRVLMEDNYQPIVEVFHKQFKNKNISE